MAGSVNLYKGGNYGLESPSYSDYSAGDFGSSYPVKTGNFGVPSDPRMTNQVLAVSNKLNTGAKTIEVSGVSLGGQGPLDLMDQIPKQQFKEINRLKQLTGVDLTFHGPIVEASGFTGRQGWTETDRRGAERQMWSAVERAQELDPDGNIIVTFHSSNGLPEPLNKMKNDNGEEIITSAWGVDEREGRFVPIELKKSYLEDNSKLPPQEQVDNALKNQNEELWFKQLQGVSYHANNGENVIREVLNRVKSNDINEKDKMLGFYKKYLENSEAAQQDIEIVKKSSESGPQTAELMERSAKDLVHADLFIRDAYENFKGLFDQAYDAALRNKREDDLQKLDKFRQDLSPKINYIKDPEKIEEFAEEISKGINVLRSIKTPQVIKPLQDFAIDKSSETFSNLALSAYKKFENNAPIISIENPPAGGALSRGEDLRDLIVEARKKFVRKAVEENVLSEDEAKREAAKLIGATWDVGHINMLRKFGYDDKKLISQGKTIAPFVKHVHLSDNFGMEHTELPMGMGNVPLKPQLEAIQKYNDKVKMIVETGSWFKDFKTTPLRETLAAFGSPVYGMKMAPYWAGNVGRSGGYFSGYGTTLPEQHFSMYGSGFSTLPVELGGQLSGRSRLSGTPSE